MNEAIALSVLQLVALTIPPIAVLIQMVRKSENLPWRMRKLSFGLALTSALSFIGTGAAVTGYILLNTSLGPLLQLGLGLTVFGLIPFAAFIGVLYQEHKAAVGP
ncbi:hypothetical protein NDI56_14320 [Haloarcula sp. S1CR25-12]|uniref:Uncharacterized protein n=1 Tax=Haloarcula saliterrae TaxID=2950534 RepID=A0ABU2FE84_9EURY|nr:hypothetical protein [Haloarcula sp. S1CR25-12]MDS0260578.1 hypothetical protein [Haloarcula sp. S1CR25-12]